MTHRGPFQPRTFCDSLIMVVAVEEQCFNFFLLHILSESLYGIKAEYFDKNALYRQSYFFISH